MRDRIRSADSLVELERLIREAEQYRKAKPYTERTWHKAAEVRREELK